MNCLGILRKFFLHEFRVLYFGYFSIYPISKFFYYFHLPSPSPPPQFRPDRDTFMHITSGNVPKWSNPQESILKPKLQAVRHYKTRFRYFLYVYRHLWLIFFFWGGGDLYSLTEFRGQGKKISLNSLSFLPYKSFLYLCRVRADNVPEKKRLFHAPRDWYIGSPTTH